MRSALGLLLVMSAVPMIESGEAAAEDTCNPPFLGITMGNTSMGVVVEAVTPGTGAAIAGLARQDVIVKMDGASLHDLPPSAQNPGGKPAYEVLIDQIKAHTVGDEVALEVVHDGKLRSVTAVLSSRVDVMQQRVVGSKLEVPVTDLDSERELDLGELVGHTTVIGWSVRELGGVRCSGCVAVLDRIAERLKTTSADDARVALVTSDDVDSIRRERSQLATSIPVLVADHGDIESTLAFVDPRRLGVTISDSRGVAQFVSVILPGADDEDAVIDEVVAAVEQANHRARR